jgi:hypothetical protein
LLLSPELYVDVRGLISEKTEGLEMPDVELPDIGDLGFGSDFEVDWLRFEDYDGDTIYAALETRDDEPTVLGPLNADIDPDGKAALTFDEGFNEWA